MIWPLVAHVSGHLNRLKNVPCFIVGANASLPPAPLDQFTGVVHLAGDVANFPTSRAMQRHFDGIRAAYPHRSSLRSPK